MKPIFNQDKNQTQLIPVPALSDNYIWMVRRNGHALVVDPGESAPIEKILEQHPFKLDAILLTHHHGDHVGGVLQQRPEERDVHEVGHHHAPAGDATAATVAQPTKVDNNLYVRDYGKCILCYKCVDACGEQAQNTFAIGVAGRGFDARISTEAAVRLPESACVYCGNCIGVCPTGALMFKSEYDMRGAGTWDESAQTVTETICPYCGVGCAVELHAQDDRIVKVTSPTDSSVTDGHLCIKGRFGFEFVNNRPGRGPA